MEELLKKIEELEKSLKAKRDSLSKARDPDKYQKRLPGVKVTYAGSVKSANNDPKDHSHAYDIHHEGKHVGRVFHHGDNEQNHAGTPEHNHPYITDDVVKEIESHASHKDFKPKWGKNFPDQPKIERIHPDAKTKPKLKKSSIDKSELVKALEKAGHRQSAMLLKNWGTYDFKAKQFIEQLN